MKLSQLPKPTRLDRRIKIFKLRVSGMYQLYRNNEVALLSRTCPHKEVTLTTQLEKELRLNNYIKKYGLKLER